MKAALEYKLTGVEHRSRIQILVNNILPGLVGSPMRRSSKEEMLPGAIEANVRWSMKQLLETPEGQEAVKNGSKLVGAVYDIVTGEVRFLA